jgi:antagonist of KipI
MGFIIIHTPGWLTTIQDRGRFGYQRFGMSVSGAMDLYAFRLANLLVGNHPDDACLETTLSGPEIEFTSPCRIAVTGADMGPRVNGKTVPLWEKIDVREGDRLHFSGLTTGCRSYIAFSGGVDVPLVMGSRSTYIPARIGGFEGRLLKWGDRVPIGEINVVGNHIRKIPTQYRPTYSINPTVRMIPGPEVSRFNFEGIRNLLTATYTVSNQSNRMGFRLTGPVIPLKSGTADILSSGISPGTIQVSGDGQPIVLMADRQTTGGYARIAHIVSVDIPLVAQLKPGDTMRFREITLQMAQNLIQERERLIAGLIP